ncbi:SDR family oxidoreductase [Sutterella seckii]|uniref:SDR family oxidoreductase n=1 Tax=Sutterella seckii TaxID=1944635 RepID=A0A6I1EQH0_9BURK|nr:SDR family oxidoreductase [Sutterella seckii]KAB7662806.1 SDR family oxidoreductase [Sutterella seckii]MBS5217729.1 SDR family oxidoreductase [Sutterella wadsworthensis]
MLNVFITGASSGIGAALARAYAARGATVGLVARSRDRLEELADSLNGGLKRHFVLPADVTNREEIFAAAREFECRSGGTTLVIANAGISHGVKTEYEEDLDMLEAVYRINVFAMAYTFHPFIEPMKARGYGQLVGMGSVAGIRGLPGSEAYCASKSAVITYCESLRIELQKYGILVSTICPGFVRTPLTAENPYKMPFIMEPDDFAREAVKAITERTTYRVIPWQMGVLAKIMRLIPNSLFDRILANRKQKPRVTTPKA